jgi:hypothetical protein
VPTKAIRLETPSTSARFLGSFFASEVWHRACDISAAGI